MSDLENNAVIQNQEAQQDNTDNPIESLAKSYGWSPDEGEKTAEEFIKFALEELPNRGKALKSQKTRIDAKDRELSDMRIVLDQLANDVKKQKETAYNQALAELKAHRKQAIANGDLDTVEQLEKHKEAIDTSFVADQMAAASAAITEWQTEHADWFNGDTLEALEIKGYAMQIEPAIQAKGLPIHEHLARLDEALIKKFPRYFNGEETQKAAAVEPAQQENSVSMKKREKKFSINDLNDHQKLAAKYLSDRGQLSVEDYIKELVKNGDLK